MAQTNHFRVVISNCSFERRTMADHFPTLSTRLFLLSLGKVLNENNRKTNAAIADNRLK